MKYISLFSGIEAATVAFKPLGWEPLGFCEIEPFPCAVLKHHYPEVPNFGDITQVDWRSLRGKADVVIGGSPCQSFSIAGNREGLAGESGLMFEYIRAVREIRPRWFIWENVPGAFSVEHGGAFGQLLSEMDKLGYGMAWRVLDAQFFGVAQRRRRVFLVGSLGTMRAADVLFEPESMSGNFESSSEKRETLTASAKESVGTSGFKYHKGAGAGSIGYEKEQSPTLTADWHQPAILSFKTDHLTQNGRIHDKSGAAFTLDTTNSNAVCIQVTSPQNGNNPQWGDPCHTLSANAHPPTVICMADDTAKAAVDKDLCGSLKCGGGTPIVASSTQMVSKSQGHYAQETTKALETNT